jgi:hypothetical protein
MQNGMSRHPEERALARVSKDDGGKARCQSRHPSRPGEDAGLLRMTVAL